MRRDSKITNILGSILLIMLLVGFLNSTLNITSLSFERLIVFSVTAFFGSLIVDTPTSEKMKSHSMLIALFMTFCTDFLLSFTESYNKVPMIYMVGIFITTWFSVLDFRLKKEAKNGSKSEI